MLENHQLLMYFFLISSFSPFQPHLSFYPCAGTFFRSLSTRRAPHPHPQPHPACIPRYLKFISKDGACHLLWPLSVVCNQNTFHFVFQMHNIIAFFVGRYLSAQIMYITLKMHHLIPLYKITQRSNFFLGFNPFPHLSYLFYSWL